MSCTSIKQLLADTLKMAIIFLRLLLDVCLMVGVVGKTFPKGANVLQEFRAFLN
jgi:hypothetical protein